MKITPSLSRVKRGALDLIFPQWCIGCGKEGETLCPLCRRALPRILAPHCPKCGRPLSTTEACPDCQALRWEIDGIRSLFRFEGTARKAIHQLKYRNIKTIAPPLAELLYNYLCINPLPGEVLVPVPLHPQRLRERGYNQSSLLCLDLGRISCLPTVYNSLVRQRNSPPQARTATAEARRENVNGAFICRDQQLQGKQVLLIDDVCTTGATLNSCAMALKAAGAISVWGLTVAREI